MKNEDKSTWLNDHDFSMGVSVCGHLVTSTLLISDAGQGDAGPYSCTLPVFSNKDFPRARAYVHVIYGEYTFLGPGLMFMSFMVSRLS